MSFTDAEEKRIQAIEEAITKLLIAVNNLAAKKQLSQLTLLKQADIDNLTQRVTALESQLTLVQAEL